MTLTICENPQDLGKSSGELGASLIRKAITEKGTANIILATGTSQFETLNQLLEEKNMNWEKVTVFHLDEYIGLPISHPASFRKYLKERFLDLVPLRSYHLINGEDNPAKECARLSDIILAHPIDVAFVGIGENCHLAFNDPPADFETEQAYIIVELDQACRQQQMREGWFPDIGAVPKKAISMSIQQILKSQAIICSVPEERKAQAVKDCLEGEISNLHPASILQQHPKCWIYIDQESSSLLTNH